TPYAPCMLCHWPFTPSKMTGRVHRWNHTWVYPSCLAGVEAEGLGHFHEVSDRARAHLARDVAPVDLHGDLGEAHPGGNLLVHQASGHELHDLLLALRQGREIGAHGGVRLILLASRAVASKRELHSVEHVLIAEWLGQEFEGAGLHRPDRHGDVAVCRDEDDRNPNARFRELG